MKKIDIDLSIKINWKIIQNIDKKSLNKIIEAEVKKTIQKEKEKEKYIRSIVIWDTNRGILAFDEFNNKQIEELIEIYDEKIDKNWDEKGKEVFMKNAKKMFELIILVDQLKKYNIINK